MKTRVVLSSVLLLVLGVTSSAQSKPAIKPEAKEGETVKLRLTGDIRDIPIEELIKWWCEYEKVNVMYQPTQVASFKVSLMVPTSGTDIPADKFGQLVSDALEPFGLVVVEISEIDTASCRQLKPSRTRPLWTPPQRAWPLVGSGLRYRCLFAMAIPTRCVPRCKT